MIEIYDIIKKYMPSLRLEVGSNYAVLYKDYGSVFLFSSKNGDFDESMKAFLSGMLNGYVLGMKSATDKFIKK